MCALRRLRPEQRFARKARAVRRRPLRQNGKFAAGCSLPSCRRRRTLSCRALVRRAEASARGGPQFWRMRALRRLRPEQRFARKGHAVGRLEYADLSKSIPRGIGGPKPPPWRRAATRPKARCISALLRGESEDARFPAAWANIAISRFSAAGRSFAPRRLACGVPSQAATRTRLARKCGGPNPKMPAAGEGVATVRNMRSMRAPILRKGARILREGMQSFIGRTQLKKRVCK